MAVQIPSLFQIALTDVRIQQWINSSGVLNLFGLLLVFAPGYRSFGLVLLVGAGALGAAIVWRMRYFRALLDHAEEVPGEVVSVRRSLLFARRGRSSSQYIYTYTYQQQHYRGTCFTIQMPRATAVQPGETVVVLVHRERPQQAIVPRLYTNT